MPKRGPRRSAIIRSASPERSTVRGIAPDGARSGSGRRPARFSGGGHRRRTGRAHRRSPAGRGGGPGGGGGAGRCGRRHQSHGGARRLALRHRRPPLLHQGSGGGEILAPGSARRRLPPPAPDEPDLLRGQVLRLPDQVGQCPPQPGHHRGIPLRVVLPVGADPPTQGPHHPGGLHRGQLRMAPLPAFLQDLQREVVGGVGLGDLGRLGSPTHQGNVAVERGVGAGPGLVGRKEAGRVEAGDQPHRGIPVPEAGAGHDVGALCRPGRADGRHHPDGHRGDGRPRGGRGRGGGDRVLGRVHRADRPLPTSSRRCLSPPWP